MRPQTIVYVTFGEPRALKPLSPNQLCLYTWLTKPYKYNSVRAHGSQNITHTTVWEHGVHQTLQIQWFECPCLAKRYIYNGLVGLLTKPYKYISLKVNGSPNVTYTKVCRRMANQTLQISLFLMFHMFSMFSMFCMFCLGCRFSMFSSFAGFLMFTGFQCFPCFIGLPGFHVFHVFKVFQVFPAGARAGAVGLKVSPCRCHFPGLPHS